MTPSTGDATASGVVDGQPACSFAEPWLTTFRGLASYTVPKIDVLVSAIVRSQANVQPGADVATNGASRAANFLMNAAQFQAATGRPLRPGVTTETVNLLLPGQLYGERVNNLDMRVAKVVRIKGTRANIGVDFYNLTNAQHADRRWIRPTRSGGARRALAAPDGGAAAAVRAVQRAVRFLIANARWQGGAEAPPCHSAYAVAAAVNPSSRIIASRMTNFCALPVTVTGSASTKRM